MPWRTRAVPWQEGPCSPGVITGSASNVAHDHPPTEDTSSTELKHLPVRLFSFDHPYRTGSLHSLAVGAARTRSLPPFPPRYTLTLLKISSYKTLATFSLLRVAKALLTYYLILIYYILTIIL